MDKPDLYNQTNDLARDAAKYCLSQYASKIQWKSHGGRAIDVGCGDGSVTSVLNEYIPKNYEFVLSDINEKMLKYAAEHYGDKSMTFRVLDVEGEISDELRCGFDHVFSLFVFHFVKNQEKGFTNIYDLLKEGGDCIVTILGDCLPYQVYEILGKEPKWSSSWLKDPSIFVSPYHNMKNKEDCIKQLLKKIGFKNIEVECKTMSHSFPDGKTFKELLSATDPYGMPPEVHEEFTRDFVVVGQQVGLIKKTTAVDMADIHEPIIVNYGLIMIYARK